MKNRILTRSAVTLICLASMAGAVYANDDLSRLATLDKQEKYQEAYILAKQLESKYSGNPQFDMLLGKAALGELPQEAIFAYDRVLITDPTNSAALFGAGYSYYDLKNTEAARTYFTKLLNTTTDPSLRTIAQEYLDKITILERKLRTTTAGFVRVNTGYSSNVNASPFESELPLPFGGILTLNRDERAVPTGFNDLGAGVVVNHRFNKNYSYSTSFNAFRRFNYALIARRFQTSTMALAGTFAINKGSWQFSFPSGIALNYDAENVLAPLLFGQSAAITHIYGRNEFSASASVLFPTTGYNLSGSLAWTYSFLVMPLQITGTLSAANGTLYTVDVNRQGNESWGGQLQLMWNGFVRQTPYVSFTYSRSLDRAPNPVYLVHQSGDFYNFVAGIECKLTDHVYLTPTYTYSRNYSTVNINNYTSNDIQAALEYRIY